MSSNKIFHCGLLKKFVNQITLLCYENVTGCMGPGTSRQQEMPFKMNHKQLNLFYITVYCPCHKQCTLQFIKPFEHCMLEPKSNSVLRGQKPPLNYNDK